jgi:hypothetical protein
MFADPTAELFRRELPEHITVSVDGVYADLVPEDEVKDTRSVGRVVLAMPDFYADSLARSIAALWRLVDGVGGGTKHVGPTERAIAEALFEAAQFMGYRSPDGSLGLPSPEDDEQHH